MTVTAVKPAPTIQALRERVIEARRAEHALRISGAGQWLDAGRPVHALQTLSTRELSGITDYVPGDLTLTARAGTTLAEIHSATLAHGQWLALDPYGTDRGTIGATVATASAGPLAAAFGTPRDLTLGLEFIMGTGVVARGGGRVVKNVAGFDLTRLLTGSWGTLGIITEVTVRLHARPETDESFAVALAPNAIGNVRKLLRRLPFTPYALEVLNVTLARRLVAHEQETALIRLGGNAESVAAQRAALLELGEPRPVHIDVWQRLREMDGGTVMTFRLSQLSSSIGRTWSEAATMLAPCDGAMMHASPARGIVRCIVPSSAASIAALRRGFSARATSTRVGERVPAELWPLLAPPTTDNPLSKRIKRTFDPAGVLNPGIFGEPEGASQ